MELVLAWEARNRGFINIVTLFYFKNNIAIAQDRHSTLREWNSKPITASESDYVHESLGRQSRVKMDD
jgi:predicted alpha/beta superfamily hydrolase